MKETYLFGFILIHVAIAYGAAWIMTKKYTGTVGFLMTILIGLAIPAATVAIGFALLKWVFPTPGFGMLLAVIMLGALITAPFTIVAAILARTVRSRS